MSSAHSAFSRMHGHLFSTIGEPATVQRGNAEPEPVRVIITRGVERAGEFGQVVAHVTTADFMLSQWDPKAGDRVTWTDHMGTFTRTISTEITHDTYVAKTVLHG